MDSAPATPEEKPRRTFGQIEHVDGRVNAVFHHEGRRFRRACFDVKQAENRLASAEELLGKGRSVEDVLSMIFDDPGGARSTFAALSKEFLEHIEKTGEKKTSTVGSYKTLVNVICCSASWAGRRIGKITSTDIVKWLSSRIEKDEISVATANRNLSAVSSIFRYAVAHGKASVNPVRLIQRFSEAGRAKGVCLSPEQVQRLLDAAPDDHFRLFMLACVETGVRYGELIALRRRNVLFGNREKGESGIILFRAEDTKGRRRHECPMTEVLESALVDAWPKDFGLDDRVFTQEGGQEWNYSAVGTMWDKTKANCRDGKNKLPGEILDGLRFYDFNRHTGASFWLHALKGDTFRTCKFIGHTNPAMIMARYGHVLREGFQDAARLRSAAIPMSAKPPQTGLLRTPTSTPKTEAAS
jgi:integrase